MFGSQALETAIGLAAMFFILATAASAITESISRVFKKRSTDLEKTIKEMLTDRGGDEEDRSGGRTRLDRCADFFGVFKGTSIWQASEAAAGRGLLTGRKVGASYLSAKAFADTLHELLKHEAANLDKGDTAAAAALERLVQVPSLKKRLDVLVGDATQGIAEVKAGLESWFDETMGRAEGAYKRWAALVLFVVGLFLAVAGNASTVDVARDLWSDSATRAAVVEAARNTSSISTAAADADNLSQLHLPVGWDTDGKDATRPDNPADFYHQLDTFPAWVTMMGWLLTAVLVMLGGPFWFDLLTRLVALRSAGSKPPSAADDATSATRAVTAAAARPELVSANVTVENGRPARPTSQPPDDLGWLRELLADWSRAAQAAGAARPTSANPPEDRATDS